MNTKITNPSDNEIKKYLDKWNSLENYILQENALDKLFFSTYPANKDINDILIKASALNDFYSTNIFSIFTISKHILELNIDKRIEQHDLNLVNDIANVTISGRQKNFYSFATKYCSHHNPILFPIYDSYVEKVLLYFNKTNKFYKFEKSDFKDYHNFYNILCSFKEFYKISYSLKDIDKYLWQLGKEFFPKKY